MKTLTPQERAEAYAKDVPHEHMQDYPALNTKEAYLAGDKDREAIEAEKREATANGFEALYEADIINRESYDRDAQLVFYKATLAAEARHQEALRVKDAEMMAAKRNNIKLFEEFKMLESRIYCLREYMGQITDIDAACSYVMIDTAFQALDHDDKAKEMK